MLSTVFIIIGIKKLYIHHEYGSYLQNDLSEGEYPRLINSIRMIDRVTIPMVTIPRSSLNKFKE